MTNNVPVKTNDPKFPLPISKNSLTFSKIPLSFFQNLTKKNLTFFTILLAD